MNAYPPDFFSTPKRKAIARELRHCSKRMNALFREAARSGIMVEIGIDSVRGYDIGTYGRPPEEGERYTKDFALCVRTANISVWVKRHPCEKERNL